MMHLNRRAAIRAGLILLLVLHFVCMYTYFEPAIFSPDAHGYLLQARLLAEDGQTWFTCESPLQHTGIHWYEAEGGRYYSHYPFGMAVPAAILYQMAGPTAALLVNVLLANLALLGFFLLCRVWLGGGWGLLATAAMAINPIFNNHTLNKDAHVAVACALLWGLYLLLRWSRSRSPGCAFLVGLILGTLPAIRYPAILYGLVPVAFALIHHRSDRRTRVSYLSAGIGALIPIGALLWHNQSAFDAFWKTGYSLTNEQTAFALSHFAQHFVPYIRSLLSDGAGLFLPLGIAAAAALWGHRRGRWASVLLIVAIAPITVLYMAYYWIGGGPGGGGAFMRFLIPTFFLYVLAGAFLLKEVADRWGHQARGAIIALFAVHAIWAAGGNHLALTQAEANGFRQAAVSRWIADRVEPGSLIIAPGPIQDQLDLLGRWRLVDERALPAGQRRTAGQPKMRPLHPQEEQSASRVGPHAAVAERGQRYRDLSPRENLQLVAADLCAWAQGDRRIYWVVPEERFSMDRRQLSRIATFIVIDSLELPRKIPLRHRPGGGFPGQEGPMRMMPPVGGMNHAADGRDGAMAAMMSPMDGMNSPTDGPDGPTAAMMPPMGPMGPGSDRGGLLLVEWRLKELE